MKPLLVDRFGRVHSALRISVTDRCNIRCQYCMSDGPIRFLPRQHLLSYEQIAEVVQAVAPIGLTRLRLTGGEPLVRNDLSTLVAALAGIPEVEEIAMTTNGMLLYQQIDALVNAGLDRINISLDTLNEETFRKMSRREGIELVLQGIDAAVQRKLPIRLNAVVLRDVNFHEIIELTEFALERNLTMRFIEFMPLDQDRNWNADQVVRGEEIRNALEQRFGAMVPVQSERSSQPSQDYRFGNSTASVGFIDPVSQPFCSSCDRMRLTADGRIRNCLFGREEWNLKPILESELEFEAKNAAIIDQFRQAVMAKHASHGIASEDFVAPERAMYQIGG